VLGVDVQAGGIHLRGRIGYMPERDSVIPGLSGVEFVTLAGELCGMARKQALRRAHEMLSWLGMEDARYRRIEQYSVGMRQRLKLAATLVHDPDVLLLDEPTAGLDPEGRTAMLSLLLSLAERPHKSLLLSSHLLDDVERVCSSAVILDRSRVVGFGRIEELRRMRQRCYRIRWDGNTDAFLTDVRERGCKVHMGSRAGEARVVVSPEWSTRTFFAIADRQGTVLTGLEPEEEDFEAIYHRLIADDDGQDQEQQQGGRHDG
jgi:ABC-2 type transport system ATP-binding protein